MTSSPDHTFNDGRTMPQLGFGTWEIPDEAVTDAVAVALDTGYRMVDTAAVYRNEKGVGKALAGRDDIFLTTKIWNSYQGYEEAKEGFEKSLGRLGRDSVDLVLIHWPMPEHDKYVDTWKAMIDLRDTGKVTSIGVSNFQPDHLRRIVDETGVTPVLNQIELHPAFQQRELRKVHEELGIVTQSWSPLGKGLAIDGSVVSDIARELGRPPAAVIIRWHIQHGLSVIPRSTNPDHIAENHEAVEFELSDQQMARIDALDQPDGRRGPHPDEMNLA